MTQETAQGPAPLATGPRSNAQNTRRVSATSVPRRPVDVLLSRLEDVRETSSGWLARCPSHTDDTPSLSVAEAPSGAALVFCFAGCPTTAVLAALGLEWRDLFPHDAAPRRGERRRRRRGGLSEAEVWQRFKAARHRLRLALATMIREAESAARSAGPALFDDDELVTEVRRLGWREYLLDLLLGDGNPDEQLWAVTAAAEEVRRHGRRG